MAEVLRRKTTYEGLTFQNLRGVLFNMFFYYDGMPDADAKEMLKYVVPMMHSVDNPLQGDEAVDTFIQFWIVRDERYTMDTNNRGDGTGVNETLVKVADILLRFVGVEAEIWAKAFHHVNQRPSVQQLIGAFCQGSFLEGVGAITPVNIDYFGVGGSSIAFDLTFKIKYKESIKLDWKPLELIVLGEGDIKVSGEIVESAP